MSVAVVSSKKSSSERPHKSGPHPSDVFRQFGSKIRQNERQNGEKDQMEAKIRPPSAPKVVFQTAAGKFMKRNGYPRIFAT
jgi:hypothetical protein